MHLEGYPSHPMIILCLAAFGLSVTTLAYAFRRIDEGYQDDGGFHNGPKTGSDVQ